MKRRDKEILDWLDKLDPFARINYDTKYHMTWGVYLYDENLTGRPTQLIAAGSTFRKLIEAAMERENMARLEL
jgi:hypothetical protein